MQTNRYTLPLFIKYLNKIQYKMYTVIYTFTEETQDLCTYGKCIKKLKVREIPVI